MSTPLHDRYYYAKNITDWLSSAQANLTERQYDIMCQQLKDIAENVRKRYGRDGKAEKSTR